MANPIKLLIFPVSDVEKAKTFYNTFLGTEPYADSPYYVGYKVGELEIGLVPNSQDLISYIDTDDIKGSIKELEAVGGTLQGDVKNVAPGLIVAAVKDVDGNVMGLRQQSK